MSPQQKEGTRKKRGKVREMKREKRRCSKTKGERYREEKKCASVFKCVYHI